MRSASRTYLAAIPLGSGLRPVPSANHRTGRIPPARAARLS